MSKVAAHRWGEFEWAKLWELLAIVLSVIALVSLGLRLRKLDSVWVEPPDESSAKWEPTVFKSLTFGHWPAAIDWLWIQTIVDSFDRSCRAGDASQDLLQSGFGNRAGSGIL